MARIAPAPESTKSQAAAPRDSASMPPAPVPANRSAHRAPRTRSPRLAKRPPRARSDSGRVPPGTGGSRFPLAEPAMTLIPFDPGGPLAVSPRGFPAWGELPPRSPPPGRFRARGDAPETAGPPTPGGTGPGSRPLGGLPRDRGWDGILPRRRSREAGSGLENGRPWETETA